MSRTKGHTLIAMACLPGLLCAQVSIDGRLILTGELNEQRQVLGLPPSTMGADVLTAQVEQQGSYALATTSATTPSTWQASLPSLVDGPVPGTHLLIAVPATDSVAVSLAVNQGEPYPLTFRGEVPLTADVFPVGTMLSLVFDGAGYQVMNAAQHLRLPCPPDMVTVNELYCIDRDEHPAISFYGAALYCVQENKRLCSWGEWYVACHYRTPLGLDNMIDNGEWTNNTANADLDVRIAGPFCTTAGTGQASSPARPFHCCMSR